MAYMFMVYIFMVYIFMVYIFMVYTDLESSEFFLAEKCNNIYVNTWYKAVDIISELTHSCTNTNPKIFL